MIKIMFSNFTNYEESPGEDCQAACSAGPVQRPTAELCKEEETDCPTEIKFSVTSQVSHSLYNTQDDLSGEGERIIITSVKRARERKKKSCHMVCGKCFGTE